MRQRAIQPGDTNSLTNERERLMVEAFLETYRDLPDSLREALPGVLGDVGRLRLLVGDFSGAFEGFRSQASQAEIEQNEPAEAHVNAYRVALEERNFAGAAEHLGEAIKIDAARHSPFPPSFELRKILGAGASGVVFSATTGRCRPVR